MARRSRLVRPFGDEVVGGGVEVVEHVLLVAAAAGVVPLLAVLEPAAQAGDGVQPAGRAPRGDLRLPRRRLGDGEAAVAVEDRRASGARRDVGAVDQEQPDRRAVERRVRRPGVTVSAGHDAVAGASRDPPGRGVARRRATARRRGERVDDGERPRPVVAVGARPATATTSPSPATVPSGRAVGVERRIVSTARRGGHHEQAVAADRRRCESRRRARRRASPSRPPRRVERDAHDAAAWRVERGDADERLPVGGEVELGGGLDARDRRVVHASVERSSRWTSMRPQPTHARRRAASGRPATRRPAATPAGRGARPTPPGRRASRRRARGGAPCGGTRRPRGSGCRRSPEPSGSHATLHARVSGISSPRSPAVAARRARGARSPRCRPRSCRRRRAHRRRTPRTSRWRWPRRRCRRPGRASTTGAAAGSIAERRVSTNCSAPAGRSRLNRWSPRTWAALHDGQLHQRDEALVPAGAIGTGVERLDG